MYGNHTYVPRVVKYLRSIMEILNKVSLLDSGLNSKLYWIAGFPDLCYAYVQGKLKVC